MSIDERKLVKRLRKKIAVMKKRVIFSSYYEGENEGHIRELLSVIRLIQSGHYDEKGGEK